jgi:hypothetical protein
MSAFSITLALAVAPLNVMPFQLPGAGAGWFEVKRILLSTVPWAMSTPR